MSAGDRDTLTVEERAAIARALQIRNASLDAADQLKNPED